MSAFDGTYHRYTNERGEECVKHIDFAGAVSIPGVWTIAGMRAALAAIDRPILPPDLSADRERALKRKRMDVCTLASCNAVPITRVWMPSMVNLQDPDNTIDGLDFCFTHAKEYIRRLPDDSDWVSISLVGWPIRAGEPR